MRIRLVLFSAKAKEQFTETRNESAIISRHSPQGFDPISRRVSYQPVMPTISYDQALAQMQSLFPAFDISILKAALRAQGGRFERSVEMLSQLQDGTITADSIFSAAEAAKRAKQSSSSSSLAPSSSSSLSMDPMTDIERAAISIAAGQVPDDFLRPPSYFRVSHYISF